jgi:hypothetical protein
VEREGNKNFPPLSLLCKGKTRWSGKSYGCILNPAATMCPAFHGGTAGLPGGGGGQFLG